MAIKTSAIVDVYLESLYLGRGIVVAQKNCDTIEVETFDGCRYSCAEQDLDVIDE
jgi:hypothetical protein